MGKRKASRKIPVKKNNVPLANTFKCLFCHHDKSVSVKMDKGTMFGHLTCKTCGQHYTTPINSMPASRTSLLHTESGPDLSAAVDVYCDWVDACEELRQKQPKKQRPVRGPSPLAHGPQGGANLQISNGEEVDVDADGEDDDPGHKRSAAAVADDDDGDDDGDLEDSGEKRRRVEVAGYDDYV